MLALRGLEHRLASFHGFAVKPSRGSGGRGIVVIEGQEEGGWRKIGGRILAHDELRRHVADGMAGRFSLDGEPDRMFVEGLLRKHPAFDPVAFGGVPDVRVIVRDGTPAMAMTRLPTSRSDGRANLAQGAIGAGIDLATGCTIHAIRHGRWGDEVVERHPDTGAPVLGFRIPGWNRILEMSRRCAEAFGLGYLGVDVIVDRAWGPMIVELNARPGLSIQNANGRGLLGSPG